MNTNKTVTVTDFGACPGSATDQTYLFQNAIDACRDAGGGTVVVPEGQFIIAGIRLWDNITLKLLSGAVLLGHLNCEEYRMFTIPENVELRTDHEMFGQPNLYPPYRRAMIAAFGVSNIEIIGEPDSVIDGRDCFDPRGEEDFRGPHGIFLTNCNNIRLHGYTIQNTGAFMHQLDKCNNVEMTEVTSLAGHDGIHLHVCSDMRIENCIFRSGDDCIAGADADRILVKNCELNTACNVFRIGGTDWTIEDCRIWGPGVYPHRLSIVKSRDHILPPEQGRHNTIYFLEYFCSMFYPPTKPARNWNIRNCTIDGVDGFLHYEANKGIYAGAALAEINFENLKITNMHHDATYVVPDSEYGMKLTFKNVTATGRDGLKVALYNPDTPNLTVVEE